jgi:hypothetical protein
LRFSNTGATYYQIPKIFDIENESYEIKVFNMAPFMEFKNGKIMFEKFEAGSYPVTIQLMDARNRSRNYTIEFIFEGSDEI